MVLMSINQNKLVKHILILGGYGGGNVGDYITLDQAIYTLKQHYPQATLSILELNNPALTQGLYPKIPVVSERVNFKKRVMQYVPMLIKENKLAKKLYTQSKTMFKSILNKSMPDQVLTKIRHAPLPIEHFKQADLIYCVGGGYLNDIYRFDLYIRPLQLANQLGIPIETAPLGLGPFTQADSLKNLTAAFQHAKVRVRDEKSAQWVKPLLNPEVCPDDGHAWAARQPGKVPSLRTERLRLAICPLISIEDDQEALFSQWWKAAINHIDNTLPIEWVPFSFDYNQDREAQLLRSLWPDKPVIMPLPHDFTPPVQAIQQADVVITGRFHATVMANNFNVPCLSVYCSDFYRSKLEPLALPNRTLVHAFHTLPVEHVPQVIQSLLAQHAVV
jgi:polysaccharide pyruvyl transferase WcaK-like protein